MNKNKKEKTSVVFDAEERLKYLMKNKKAGVIKKKKREEKEEELLREKRRELRQKRMESNIKFADELCKDQREKGIKPHPMFENLAERSKNITKNSNISNDKKEISTIVINVSD